MDLNRRQFKMKALDAKKALEIKTGKKVSISRNYLETKENTKKLKN